MSMRNLFLKISVVTLAALANNSFAENSDLLLHEYIEKQLQDICILNKFSFDGQIEITAAHCKQANPETLDTMFISSQGHIDFTYSDLCDYGRFGATMVCRTRSGLIKKSGAIVEQGFIFLETGSYGLFKVGYTKTAGSAFSISGEDCMTGYTGFGSGFLNSYYNTSSGSIIDSGFKYDDGSSAKIVWLSPVVRGFSAGLSFTFNGMYQNPFHSSTLKKDRDFSAKRSFETRTDYQKHVFTGGVAYEYGAPDSFSGKIAVAGWAGKTASKLGDEKIRNVRGYNIGLSLQYQEFLAAFSFTDMTHSFLANQYANSDSPIFQNGVAYDISDEGVGLKPGADAGKVYTVGLAYNNSRWHTSIGYLYSATKMSHNEKATGKVLSCAVEYRFDKTWSAYCEYINIVTRTCDRAMTYDVAVDGKAFCNNRANLFMIGSKIKL